MIEQSELYSRFQFYRFCGYAKTVRDILSSYEIVDVTINKIVDKINKGESGPFYVYRRAVILCDDCGEDLQITNQAYGSMPLVIVLQPSRIILYNNQIGTTYCK